MKYGINGTYNLVGMASTRKTVDTGFPEKPVISLLSETGIDEIIQEIKDDIGVSGRGKI